MQPTLDVETVQQHESVAAEPSVKSPKGPTNDMPSSDVSGAKENFNSMPLSPSKAGKEKTASGPTSPEKAAVSIVQKDEPTVAKDDSHPTGTLETAACEQKLFVVEEHHDTEVVIERLLDVKGLEQSVTGLWGWMSGGVSKVAEQASKVAEKASQEARVVAGKASQQASFVAEKASKARALAEQQAKEIAASMAKTMEDKPQIESKPALVVPATSLPWETAHPERRAEARERVMKLSMDDHTFTVPPPKEANYLYDAVAKEPYAARMLDTDALLSAKRFKLVPKLVDEQEFWRNYFYRVDLILNALGVPPSDASSPAKDAAQAEKDKHSKEVVEEAHHRDLDEEMRKEIARAEASHLDDLTKEDENFDMLEDDLEFEDDAELEKTINDLKL